MYSQMMRLLQTTDIVASSLLSESQVENILDEFSRESHLLRHLRLEGLQPTAAPHRSDLDCT